MLGPDDHPLRTGIGVMPLKMYLQRRLLRLQKLEHQAVFFGPFHLAFPTVKRPNRSIDLDANGEAILDDVRRDAFRVGQRGDGCPSDEHGATQRQTRGEDK